MFLFVLLLFCFDLLGYSSGKHGMVHCSKKDNHAVVGESEKNEEFQGTMNSFWVAELHCPVSCCICTQHLNQKDHTHG